MSHTAAPEKDIPIDINSNKLLDWLISRRHCNRDWSKPILAIRQKINDAIQDMPAVDEIASLLTGTYINYFHCCFIVDVLKKTEASSKNIFGQYSSKRMIDWLEIVKMYEKDNVYLAEAAQMLIRNVNYEIPSLKKQILKCEQLQDECLKKEADYTKSGNDMIEKYFTSCQQIGIQGNNVRKELSSLLDCLPEILSNIANKAIDLKQSRAYYLAFISYTIGRDIEETCLPLMGHIIEKGNTTTYEWRKGEPPDVIEGTQPSIPLDVENGSIHDDQIDFGDLAVPSESGDDRSSSSPNGDFVHVEKDDCTTDNGDHIDFGDNDSEVNWDITVESPGSVVASETDQDSEVSGFSGGKVARGDDALPLLENPITRNTFYNELLELKGFLEQRLIEMSSEGDVLSSNLFQSAPSIVQLQSADNVSIMLSQVTEVCSMLMSTKLKHLYFIKESNKYIDRLADSLKKKLDISEKMFNAAKLMQIKCEEAALEKKILEPKLQLIIRRTKELQSHIEEEISKRYKKRPVNIIGPISSL